MSQVTYCRIAPSLGALEGDPHEVWGTKPYHEDDMAEIIDKPCVFFGLYGLNDFYSLWRHRGKKWVLWAGSDIRHLRAGYWLEDGGGIRISHKAIGQWIDKYCESWVENEVERRELMSLGIHAQVCPSFMGRIEDYEISYEASRRPKVYASVSGDDFALYCWPEIEKLAEENPELEFHMYGNTVPYRSIRTNFIVHGRVPKEKMNEEVKGMQAALRPLEFDGFSEVLAKSVLWGQWPISKIEYPHVMKMGGLKILSKLDTPNKKGREYYIKSLNKFPWVQK